LLSVRQDLLRELPGLLQGRKLLLQLFDLLLALMKLQRLLLNLLRRRRLIAFMAGQLSKAVLPQRKIFAPNRHIRQLLPTRLLLCQRLLEIADLMLLGLHRLFTLRTARLLLCGFMLQLLDLLLQSRERLIEWNNLSAQQRFLLVLLQTHLFARRFGFLITLLQLLLLVGRRLHLLV
jgi:hypothetical protein